MFSGGSSTSTDVPRQMFSPIPLVEHVWSFDLKAKAWGLFLFAVGVYLAFANVANQFKISGLCCVCPWTHLGLKWMIVDPH